MDLLKDSVPLQLVVWQNLIELHIFQNITTEFVLPKPVVSPTYYYPAVSTNSFV
jgi:hypothetical protein